MKTIKANELIKTLDWIAQFGKGTTPIPEPKLNQNGSYECLIYIPLIEKTVIGLGDSKIEAVDNAAHQSSKIIDEYMENHDIELKRTLGPGEYILEEDDSGYVSIYLMPKTN